MKIDRVSRYLDFVYYQYFLACLRLCWELSMKSGDWVLDAGNWILDEGSRPKAKGIKMK